MTDAAASTRSAVLDVHVLPHTHWDREWYHPAGGFRLRLVALVDELLDEPSATFLLDGQAVVLDDYLAVRPERRAALADALASGRLEAGPWYVLADLLLPTGESLVRNLHAGVRRVRALGGTPPPVLYSPDAFGHAAAGPSLAAGFGIVLAVVWRGYGGGRWPAGDSAWWRGAGGERVLLHHLPPDGYEFGSRLPPSRPGARMRWAELEAVLAPRARLGAVIVMNGADHHARQQRWDEAVAALGAEAAPHRVQVSPLAAIARALVDHAEAAGGGALPEVVGELRDSYGYAWTLQGTFASRTAQKRRVRRVERELLRDVEPWVALAGLAGSAAGERARRADALRSAWRPFLLCLPHDTLCGCSTDEVARAADARLDDAAAQARALRDDALAALLGHDVVRARGLRKHWRPHVAVRNRAARARGGVAELDIRAFVRDVAVGPGSAGAWRAAPEPSAAVHLDGGRVLVQVLERAVVHDRIESPRHYPDDDLVERIRAVAWMPPVTGYGLRTVKLSTSTSDPAAHADVPHHAVRAANNQLDNGLVSVAIDERGDVRVRSASPAVDAGGVISFEDVGDAGDLYTPSPLGRPIEGARCAGVRTLHRGPLRAAVGARYRLRVPAAAAARPDGDPHSRAERRAGRHVELPLEVVAEVDADAPFVRFRLSGTNLARDHRLRVVIRTGVTADAVLADAAFHPVVRRRLELPSDEQRAERAIHAAPLHRYVTLLGAEAGATVFADGLAEYEHLGGDRVAITLVRAVGQLSRPDLPERPGHAGWPVSTPEAQCAGRFAATIALAYHGADAPSTRQVVERLADDVLCPLAGTTWRAMLYAPPSDVLGAELEGDALVATAIAPAQDAPWIATLRCMNLGDQPVRGAWTIGARLGAACLARLDETPGEPLQCEPTAGATRVAFTADPHALITILVR